MRYSLSTRRCSTLPLGILASALWLGSIGQFLGSEAIGSDGLRETPIVKAIQRAEPAVVNIQGNKTVTNTASNGVATKQEVNGMGTGVIIDRRGLIITNYHVVDSVEKIEVTLADGTNAIAKLLNYDPETDLAMIKIDVGRELPVINMGRSDDLLRGETVIAIGNPFGYQNTVTQGIISALHRDIPVNGTQQYTDLIQTNADINPGNSGGPLLNIDGEVIGINVAVRVGAQGIGFAIPIDNAVDVMSQLVAQYRKTGSHGLVCSRIETEDGLELILQDYQEQNQKGPELASATDLHAGDKIRTIAGQSVKTKLDIELALLGLPSDKPVEIEVQRQDAIITSNVHLHKTQTDLTEVEIRNEIWEKIGIRVTQVPASAVEGIDKSFQGGLKISDVRPNSPASRLDFSTGDIIVGVMRWQTPNIKALGWIMSEESFLNASTSKFYLVRRNRSMEVAMSLNTLRR